MSAPKIYRVRMTQTRLLALTVSACTKKQALAITRQVIAAKGTAILEEFDSGITNFEAECLTDAMRDAQWAPPSPNRPRLASNS